MEPELASKPTAYMCGVEQKKREAQLAEQRVRTLDHELKPRQVSFECQTRNNFRDADIAEMIRHPQYHSKRDEISAIKEVAGKPALELSDMRLKGKFASKFSDFPQKPTVQMCRESKYHITKEIQRDKKQQWHSAAASKANNGAPAIPYALSRTSSGELASVRQLSRDDILGASSHDLTQHIHREMAAAQAPSWNTTIRAADTSGKGCGITAGLVPSLLISFSDSDNT